MTPAHDAERLTDIMERVEKLFLAHEAERDAVSSALPSPPVAEQPILPLELPILESSIHPEYIQAEAFLEVSGFFTPSSKRIRGIYTKEKKLREYTDGQGKRRTVTVEINAIYKLGLPITSDLDYYRAFLKICDEIVDANGRFQLPIAVPTKKLIRYAGKVDSPKERREVRLWFERMTGTLMKGAIYHAKRKDFAEGVLATVFSQVVIKGQMMRSGKIADTNYVWLSPWFLSNYFYRYTRPLDFEFYKKLRKPIAKSLFTLLENGWYASEGKPYAKSYPALCEEFLLTPHRYIAEIKRQLDPSHQELQQLGFLAQWEYRKNVNGTVYIIVYYPGQKFFDDQTAKDVRRQLAERIETAKFPSPQLDLIGRSDLLLSDILDICGDRRNTAAYLKIIKTHPESIIRMALSETKQAHLEGRIMRSRGAYFTDALKRLTHYHATSHT